MKRKAGEAFTSYAIRRQRAAARRVPRTFTSTAIRARAYARSAPEVKYFDTGINAAVTSGAGDWTDSEVPCDNYVNTSGTAAAYTDSALIPSATGSGYGQIIGNAYKLKKIRVRGIIYRTNVLTDQADATGVNPVRLVLVMDTRPNGSQAQGEAVFQDTGVAETLYSFKKMSDEGDRFRILKDEIFHLTPNVAFNDAAATGTIGFMAHDFSFQYTPRIPIDVRIKVGNTTPTIAGLVNCNIFMLMHTQGTSITMLASARAYYFE